MKVKEVEYSVTAYDRTLEIEKDGEVYFVLVHWDNQIGFECNWFGADRRFRPTPEWAYQLEEENEDGESLGFILELMTEGASV